MDIDGTSMPGQGSGEIDIDQNLLLQFSCMNTTDREELIRQMQKLLGPTISHNTATFFLDMSNWNLQAAICCYLDYTIPKLPSMAVKECKNPEAPLAPGSCFEQSWVIVNTGAEGWPGSCKLLQMGGEPLGAPPVFMPPLPAGHSTTVTLPLVAPTNPGNYRGYFHLVSDKGEQIGDTLWAQITVESETTLALVEQLAALPFPNNRLDESVEAQVTQVRHLTTKKVYTGRPDVLTVQCSNKTHYYNVTSNGKYLIQKLNTQFGYIK